MNSSTGKHPITPPFMGLQSPDLHVSGESLPSYEFCQHLNKRREPGYSTAPGGPDDDAQKLIMVPREDVKSSSDA